MKIVIEGVPEVQTEDSGMAKIASMYQDGGGVFVRIQSYRDEEGDTHDEIDALIAAGKIRVTIETL